MQFDYINRIVYPYMIVKVPDGRVLMTRPSPDYGATRWSVTAHTSSRPGSSDALRSVQELLETRLGISWLKINSFSMKISRGENIMYVDKTIIPYIIKIREKVALRIDTRKFDCTVMDYKEIVSKVIEDMCHRGFSGFSFTSITRRVIQAIEHKGGL